MEVTLAPEQEDPFDLARHVGWVDEWETTTDAAQKHSQRCRDYYDGKQLTSEEIATLKQRGQPDVVFNIIQPKIDYLLGYEATTRTDPRAFPRTPNDEEAAEAATDALRYVEDSTDLDQKFSAVWENMLIEGYGGLELEVDEQTGDITVHEWAWDRLFYDPHSRKADFSDARYLGGITWMDFEQAVEMWPQAREVLDQTIANDTGRTHDDKPKQKVWVSGKDRKRVKIIQMYYRAAGQWHWCKFTKGGKIEGGPLPFIDSKGRSWCPFLIQSAYVDRDNNRYGLVNIFLSPQDEINKRRSKDLHLITQRQTKGERGAIDDVELMKAELAKPDGHVEVNPGFEFEIIDTTNQARGNFELMQQAIQHIQSIGPNSAMLGKQDGDPSGRAILANQQSGQTEMARLMDRHRHLKRRTFNGIWNLIRQYKTAEWWVRVTDDEKNVKFVGLNAPVTGRQKIEKALAANNVPPEQAAQMMAQIEQDPLRAPILEQVVDIENVPAEMDMDITIEEVPDVANVQMEQFQALTSMAPAVVFPPSVYIKASTLRNKSELLEMLDAANQNPEVQAFQKAQAEQNFRKVEAEIKKLEAETIGALAKADQADAQTGAIINPAITGPPGGGQQVTQQRPSSPAQQPGF